VGGDVQPLDEAVANRLKGEAKTILGLATGGKNK